jgi:hypothetical protein
MPKNLVSTSPSKREPNSSLSHQKRTITQSIELKKSKPSSRNEFLDPSPPYNVFSPNQCMHSRARGENQSSKGRASGNMQLPKLREQRPF